MEYWGKRVQAGTNSSLGGVEIMMLEIYDNWLRAEWKNTGEEKTK